ncbi:MULTISPECIES: hypothetical protein [Acinetobacter]|uniref:hypothetical protein n=1 Tax=Acinetobacter TaxID=469 RepID=UPI0022EB3B1A|nr:MULTISPECIES: hypothetical protein [Acinetobacter]MDA3477582.1 hypothetical protein [Acinetobacter baumannii]MDA3489849.1 hypothetical protein [Acinetobacter sp. AOR31_HL]
MIISNIRAAALVEKRSEKQEILVDIPFVTVEVKKAIEKIISEVKNSPESFHSIDIRIGFSIPDSIMKAYEKAFTEEIQKLGFGNELCIESFTFSNVGDPYFMGSDAERITNYIRIKENEM